MKAAIIAKYGDPEVFQMAEMPVPEIENGQILIQNKASSVNPVDTLVRQGKTRLITGLFGKHIIGADFSGVVIQSKNSAFGIGTEVFGMLNAVKGGAYAEMIICEGDNMAIKPANVSFTEAAVVPLVGLTAWQALLVEGKLQSGWNILITGCTGGVGTMAVQIAKHFGNIVTGTCSSDHADFAKKIGADHVIPYETEKIPVENQFDLIFDASGHFTISDLKGSLKEEALFVSTRGGTDDLGGIVQAAIDLTLQKRMKLVQVKPDSAHLYQLAQLMESGALKAYISETYPLDQLTVAHRKAEEGNFTGKIAIAIQ
jgi:NADPH:quinone reductase-like Zn-dependent oxidoreductase